MSYIIFVLLRNVVLNSFAATKIVVITGMLISEDVCSVFTSQNICV